MIGPRSPETPHVLREKAAFGVHLFTWGDQGVNRGSTKPEIACDANLSEQANAEASYALSEVAARK